MKYNGKMNPNLQYRSTIAQIYTHSPIYLYIWNGWHYGCTFLNYSQEPLVPPLHKSIKIEMYNYMYFQPSKSSINQSITIEASNQVDSEEFKLHQDEPKIMSMIELFQKYGNDLPLLKEKEIKSKCASQNDIIQSKQKLFIIKYTPQKTLRERCYIFQVDLPSTSQLSINAK